MGVLEILDGWVSKPPPQTFFGVWVHSRDVYGSVSACVPCLVLQLSCPILPHASLTENDAYVVMWGCCKYKSQSNTGGH